MNIVFALLTLVATSWLPEAICQRSNYPYFLKRQTRQDNNDNRIRRQTNADQMVQNILQWLQGVYTQSSRKIRQGTIREYLPPINTEKPRPFEPAIPEIPEDNVIGYPTPPEGVYPPIPPTYPGTGPGQTDRPQEPIYPGPEGTPQPQVPGYPVTQEPGQPREPGYPGPGTPEEKPEYPGVPEKEPGYPGPVEPGETIEPSKPEEPTGPQIPELPGKEPGYPEPVQPTPEVPTRPLEPESPKPEEPGYPEPGKPGEEPGYPEPGKPGEGPGYPEPGKPGEEPGYPGPGKPGEGPGYPEPGEEPGYPGPEKPGEELGYPGPGKPEEGFGYPEPGKPGEEPGYPGPGKPGEEPGYPGPEKPEEVPGYPGPGQETTHRPEPEGPGEPQQPGYPGPGRPGEEPGYTEPGPGLVTTRPPELESSSEPQQPEYPGPAEEPGYPGSSEGPIQPEEPQGPEQPETPGREGYPPAGETPHPPFILPTEKPESELPGQTEEPQPVPSVPTETEKPDKPEELLPSPEEPTATEKLQPEPEEPSQPGATEYPSIGPSPTPEFPSEKTEKPEEPIEPSPGGPQTEPESYTSAPGTTTTEKQYQPGDLITSAPSGKPETEEPEPEPGKPDVTITPEGSIPQEPKESTEPSVEDLSHPPHIHALDVICDQDKMMVTVEFNRQFDGIIYSKGNHNNLDCRYVTEYSGKTKYEFTVYLNQCGTELVSSGEGADSSYLENVLVMQNEAGIQEVWDTVRAVRCHWEQSLKKSLTASLSVGMLNPEIVTFSGDSVMARLDIQQGEGPFAPTANGLVPIGEKMTLVVSVTGAGDYDIQVKECKAKDTESRNEVLLSDENGCIIKPKLFGAFQKLNEPAGPTLAYAFFNAFKFPDIMDLLIECNVELCKEECSICPDPNQKLRPGRRRRDTTNNTLTDPIRIGKLLRVLLPEDLSSGEAIVKIQEEESICVSVKTFVVSTTFMISLLTSATIFSAYIYLKSRHSYHKH